MNKKDRYSHLALMDLLSFANYLLTYLILCKVLS
jgi:hypothetical protein